MRVLVAADEIDPRDGGFTYTLPGELLGPPPMVCGRPSCGCGQAFAGLASNMGTTLALVADRADLGEVAHEEEIDWSADVAANYEVGTLLVYSHPHVMPLSEWIDSYGLDARGEDVDP